MKCDDTYGRSVYRSLFSSWLTNRPAVDQPPGYSKEPRSVPKCTSMRLSYHLRNFARFFKQCQKGAELHYHLTGGAYAENANRGACFDVNKADAPARRFWSPRFPLRHESFVALLRLGRNQHLAVAQRLDVVSVGCPRRLPFCCGCPA